MFLHIRIFYILSPMGKASYKKKPICVWLLLFIEQCSIDSQILSRQLINKACSAKFRQGQRFLNSEALLCDYPHRKEWTELEFVREKCKKCKDTLLKEEVRFL